MTTTNGHGMSARRPGKTPLVATIRGLLRDPLRELSDASARFNGDIVRVNVGLFRPYLLTRPEHVQHVLRDHQTNYVRGPMLWKPLQPLLGSGLVGEGPVWRSRRDLLNPMFSAKSVATMVDQMSETLSGAAESLHESPWPRPRDVTLEMTRMAHLALGQAFFGGRIDDEQADVLGHAVSQAFLSLGPRLLMPFAPAVLPLPGDRTYRQAVRTVDSIIMPLVARIRRDGDADGADIVSLLSRATDADGVGLTDREVRDDVVAMFVAGTETTAMALTWLWVALDANPAVAATLYEEIERVVGTDRPGAAHLPGLRYTKMVIQEVLRLYPPAWMIPRMAAESDVIDGVAIEKGATVLVSPYLTHRMPELWPDPEAFDPGRFEAARDERRHRYAYFPFSGGVHQCLGSHFVTLEIQLVVAALLSRYRPRLHGGTPDRRAAVTLKPRRPVEIVFEPISRRRVGKAA